jgi:exonuclease III
VQQQFFDELSSVLERAGTYSAPMYLVGDFNIRLDRPDDPHAVNFRSLLQAFHLNVAATGTIVHKRTKIPVLCDISKTAQTGD